jgi:hypothetical protein
MSIFKKNYMKNILFAFFVLLFSHLEINAQPINKNDSTQANKFVVSTDNTRMFYKGLQNPLSISNCSSENINIIVEGAGANFRKTGTGQYIVTCTQTGMTIVTVSDGIKTEQLKIPVKRIPDPIAIVGGSAGGNMSANKFRVQAGVIAELRDFVFEGVKFNVRSFIIMIKGKDFEGKDYEEIAEVVGPAFSGGAMALIKKCQPGTTVIIGGIKVSEPGGGTRNLDQTITFILQ